MRAVLQRVLRAAVTADGEPAGSIGTGLLLLLGVSREDTPAQARLLAAKTVRLRIFEDGAGKMNRSLLDMGGEVLVVSNFTLYADSRRGRRPDFTRAAAYADAKALYEEFISALAKEGIARVETGVFGAAMSVELVNNGPVTLILDTEELE